MPDLLFAYPGDLARPTGGYVYDRRLVADLRALGMTVDLVALGDGFPTPIPAVRERAAALVAARPDVPIIVDGLALGVLPPPARPRLIALIHHPLGLETGLRPAEAAALQASERAAVQGAAAVVVTSRHTAATVQQFLAVPAGRITVAWPGVDPAPLARGSGRPEVRILSVGSLTPRKGHDLLLAALAGWRHLAWRLIVVGDMGAAGTAERLAAQATELGLAERVAFAGPLEHAALAAEYARADLFALASRYEGFGMAYAEAVAHGLPVLGTTAGAIAEAVPPGAGLLVPPDDLAALQQALGVLLGDGARRAELAAGARQAASRQHRWADTARIVADLVRSIH